MSTIRQPRPEGFGFAVAAALVAVLTYGGMIAISLYGTAERSTGGVVTSVDPGEAPDQEAAPSPTEAPDQEAAPPPTGTTGTEEGAWDGVVLLRFAVLVGVPAIALAISLLAPTRRSAVLARSAAAIVLAAMTLLTITSVGVGFALATALMITAAIKAAVPESRVTDRSGTSGRNDSR